MYPGSPAARSGSKRGRVRCLPRQPAAPRRRSWTASRCGGSSRAGRATRQWVDQTTTMLDPCNETLSGVLVRSAPGGRLCSEVSMHAEVMSSVMLSLLHGFRLKVGWRQVPLMCSSQRLVALLALKEQPPSRSCVAGTLWPETTDARANANLRSSLWRVQQSCESVVVASPQRLRLAHGVIVDQHEAVQAAQRMRCVSGSRQPGATERLSRQAWLPSGRSRYARARIKCWSKCTSLRATDSRRPASTRIAAVSCKASWAWNHHPA